MNRGDALYETRFVAFAIGVAILLLFTAPHMVWKFMGQKRATELVKRWEAEDARGRPPGSFCPVWTVRLAGYLSSTTVRRSSALSRILNSRNYLALDHHNPLRGYRIKLPSGCVHALSNDTCLLMLCMSADDDGAVDQWLHRLRPPSRHPCNLSWLPTARHVRRRPPLWCSRWRGWSPTLRRRRRTSLLGREDQLGWLQSLSPARSVVSLAVVVLYFIERVRFIPGVSFWRCGQGSHVLASCRQLYCHGELVCTNKKCLKMPCTTFVLFVIVSGKQACLHFTIFRVFR